MEKKPKGVYTFIDHESRNGRTYWVRIGTAFENEDGSLTVRLDAIPSNGSFVIRDSSPKT